MRLGRFRRLAGHVAVPLAAVVVSLMAPAGASASFVVHESARDFVSFRGDACGSTSTRALQLPAGAFAIKPAALQVGSVLHSADEDVTPVARISAVAADPSARAVRWTATGSDDACTAPSDPALDPELWDAYPVGPWETNGDDIRADYSRKVSRVFLPATCDGPRYRPAAVTLTCADANLRLIALRWTGWNDRAATARGLVYANDCTPFCAAGHFHRIPAKITASQPAVCRGVYQYLHLRYRLLRPERGFSRTGRTSFDWTCNDV
jgi:hypothetical protein